MRYIDSGSRDASEAVATWLNDVLDDNVSELRIQTGFYSRDALRPYAGKINALVASDRLIKVIIGSNDGKTLASHVLDLAETLGLPRERSQLGVVYLAGAYYHPKTIHIRRDDGSQAAYVGSANFTLPGIAAKHVEAGLLLDTHLGDDGELLDRIALAADAWFVGDRLGIEHVHSPGGIAHLLSEGIVSETPAPRPPRPNGAGGHPPARPTLTFLVNLTQPQPAALAGDPDPDAVDTLPQQSGGLPVVQHTPPYPPYMYFAPDAEGPTSRAEALTGAGLGDAQGLLVQLSRDNDRHWREAPGTANLSVPVATASTIRFGLYGERKRPRAEFDLRLRYIDDDLVLVADPQITGLMSFGHTPGDGGHADLRLVIPKPPVSQLRDDLTARGLRLPRHNDIAILEWPTPAEPSFSMTVTNPESEVGKSLRSAWQSAVEKSEMASRGACWLPAGLSPTW